MDLSALLSRLTAKPVCVCVCVCVCVTTRPPYIQSLVFCEEIF